MRSLQARGRPHEAAKEMRALLKLMHENEASVQKLAAGCWAILGLAGQNLAILDPEVGEVELIQAVAAAQAKFCMP